MPSLTDSLEQLASLSNQIQQLSKCNCRPSGPYTTAYLGASVVPDLIRDGSEAEKRLFKFIGETDSSIKKVEKREGLVTTLKDLKAGRAAKGGQGETDVVLRAVAKLVDDYRPMPRARAHIASLAERHEMQMERIAALERQIAELKAPGGSNQGSQSQEPSSPTPPAPKPKVVLSPDEAIKAEEASLRALEALIKPHREAAIAAEYASPQKFASPEKTSNFQPQSPTERAMSQPSIFEAQTPARTPAREAAHQPGGPIFGATPHRSTKINRFTPLKNPATPRTRERGSIFGTKPRSVSGNKHFSSGAPPSLGQPLSTNSPGDRAHEEEYNASPTKEDETIRLPGGSEVVYIPPEPASPTPDRSAPPEESDRDVTPRASPTKPSSPERGPRTVEGVLTDSEPVLAATTLIKNTLSDLMSYGTDDETGDAAGIITLLHRVSTSEVEDVPSSGSSVASSAMIGPPFVPVTQEAVLRSHLLLLLLRSPDLGVFEQEARDSLTAIMKERGWSKPSPLSTILGLTGKRTLHVDRKGPSGPKGIVHFR